MGTGLRRGFLLLAAALLLWLPGLGSAQEPRDTKDTRPLTEGLPPRELSQKEREEREKKLRKELQIHFKKWLDEDVRYIIIPEEKDAFFHLNNDEEREEFIEQFWLRRDPTPDSIENEFKDEHYRRIAYANERLGGWRSDRGMIYIMHGPPDEMELKPAGGYYVRLPEEGGGGTSVLPFERWRYRYIAGVGDDIVLEFVDRCLCGDYELTSDPSLKDVLYLTPGAGLSWLEMFGRAKKAERFTRADGTRLPRSYSETVDYDIFERLRVHAMVQKPPEIKFKDLEALVDTRIRFNVLPFEVRADFLRVTDETILVPITVALKKKDVTFKLHSGLQQSVVNIFGRVTTLTGRIVETFEDVIRLDVPPDLFERSLEEPALYQKALALRPGLYKLNLVLKDLQSGNVGTVEQRLTVPRFEENRLAHSSLILADLIERVPTKNLGTGQFVIGDTKIRPVVSEEFKLTDRLGIYLQVYNLGLHEQTHRPDATIRYVIRNGGNTVSAYTETTAELERVGEQITVGKLLPLANFPPGEYTLNIEITDRVRQQTVSPSARFRVRP